MVSQNIKIHYANASARERFSGILLSDTSTLQPVDDQKEIASLEVIYKLPFAMQMEVGLFTAGK